MIDMHEFLQAYVTCLLWSETVDDIDAEPDEYGERPAIPADYRYGPDDIAPEAMNEIRDDCAGFVRSHGALLLTMGERTGEDYTAALDGGHNFCLSRNGHGTGFWDRGLGELGEELHSAAKVYGTQGLYVGDDGLLYVHG